MVRTTTAELAVPDASMHLFLACPVLRTFSYSDQLPWQELSFPTPTVQPIFVDRWKSHHILQTMKKLNEELKVTFLFATHDEKVMKYLNRIVSLEDGKVVSDKETNAKTENHVSI